MNSVPSIGNLGYLTKASEIAVTGPAARESDDHPDAYFRVPSGKRKRAAPPT
ncbi:MAG: hypothetical protein WBP81_17685 [Solirubrobacteraceae bacterium]